MFLIVPIGGTMIGFPTALGLSIGVIFTLSSLAKVFDYAGFRSVVQYSLRLERPTADTLGFTIIALEALVALVGVVTAVSKVLLRADLLLAAGLVVAFTGWTLVIMYRRMSVRCAALVVERRYFRSERSYGT
jgi:hypothetical protein